MSAMDEGRALWAPTAAQKSYLKRALNQPGGKLPLFDDEGQAVDPKIIRACLANGWAKPAGTGGMNTASGIGAGKAGLAPVSSEPNRAVTASRGGFGARSGSRTTVGG